MIRSTALIGVICLLLGCGQGPRPKAPEPVSSAAAISAAEAYLAQHPNSGAACGVDAMQKTTPSVRSLAGSYLVESLVDAEESVVVTVAVDKYSGKATASTCARILPRREVVDRLHAALATRDPLFGFNYQVPTNEELAEAIISFSANGWVISIPIGSNPGWTIALTANGEVLFGGLWRQ